MATGRRVGMPSRPRRSWRAWPTAGSAPCRHRSRSARTMAPELSPGARRAARRLRAVLAALFLVYAAVNAVQLVDYSTYYRNGIWEIVAAALFVLFAAALYSRRAGLRAAAGYTGGFLLAQALVTPLLRPFDYRALQPNLVEVIDVQGD